jgi:carboxyl-terminal processing protease
MRARLLPVLLLIGLIAVAFGSPRTAVAGPSADSGLDVVRGAYDVLLDKFFRPIAPRDLLTAGWDALAGEARRAGLPDPPPLDALPEDRDAAFDTFSTDYLAYVAALPPSVSPTDVAFAVSTGMTASLHERHTNFLRPSAYNAFLGTLGNERLPVGPGIRWSSRPPWTVTAVAPNGPAADAGVQAGDVIVAVDGRDVTAATAPDLARALTGDAGTAVTLTVERGGGRLDLAVTRGPYYFPPLDSRMLADGIGYVRLEQFVASGTLLPNGTEILADFDRRLGDLDAQGAHALILDLRGNSGGSNLTAAEILGRFLPDDAPTVVFYDERGHETTGIVSGLMRRVQLPMVVLVDGGSASASEVVASTLREAGRAILVGRRTAGALASSQILPLPDGAGIQVAVAEVATARSGFRIDGAGFPVDVDVGGDARPGRDPQLDAAIAAVEQAPPPPAFQSTAGGASPNRLEAALAPSMPLSTQIPRNDRLTTVEVTGSRVLTHPNQIIDAGARDPFALQETLRRRGWLGAYEQDYAPEVFGAPEVDVTAELYSTAAGAADAIATNDAPELLESIPNLIELGDGTATYRGIWRASGEILLSWRRGDVVFTVGYFDAPGYERMDTLIAVAKLVDDAYARGLPAATLATDDLSPGLVP